MFIPSVEPDILIVGGILEYVHRKQRRSWLNRLYSSADVGFVIPTILMWSFWRWRLTPTTSSQNRVKDYITGVIGGVSGREKRLEVPSWQALAGF